MSKKLPPGVLSISTPKLAHCALCPGNICPRASGCLGVTQVPDAQLWPRFGDHYDLVTLHTHSQLTSHHVSLLPPASHMSQPQPSCCDSGDCLPIPDHRPGVHHPHSGADSSHPFPAPHGHCPALNLESLRLEVTGAEISRAVMEVISCLPWPACPDWYSQWPCHTPHSRRRGQSPYCCWAPPPPLLQPSACLGAWTIRGSPAPCPPGARTMVAVTGRMLVLYM